MANGIDFWDIPKQGTDFRNGTANIPVSTNDGTGSVLSAKWFIGGEGKTFSDNPWELVFIDGEPLVRHWSEHQWRTG